MADIKVLNGESILDSTKKALGLDKDYDVFDDTIVMHINTVFSMLHQIGASPRTGFTIIGDTEKWSDFIVDVKNVDLVKSYMYLRVRLLFDPPTTSFAIDAMKAQLDMLEWRLSIMEQSFVLGSPLLITATEDAEGVTLTLAEGSTITATEDAEGVTLPA